MPFHARAKKGLPTVPVAANAKPSADQVLEAKYPILGDRISVQSQKWRKRTRNMATSWPEGGTFDVSLCSDLKVLIGNRPGRGGAVRRQRKKEEELGILALYLNEGVNYRATAKACRESLQDPKTLPTPIPPEKLPPCGPEMAVGGLEPGGKRSGKVREIAVSGLADALLSDGDEDKIPVRVSKGVQAHTRAELKEAERPRTKETVMRKGGRQGKTGIELRIDHTEDSSADEQESRGLRQRKDARPPAQSQVPILVRGATMCYTPWAAMDMVGLMGRIPDIREGAARWIRAFEEETVGHLLAVGDIKAILTKTLGVGEMREMVEGDRFHRLTLTQAHDGDMFNTYRQSLWDQLREAFPTQVRLELLRGELLGDSESPAAHIAKIMKLWRTELGVNPEKDALQRTMFRRSVIHNLPAQVKGRLEDVVGLTSMTFAEFSGHVIHAIEKFRERNAEMLEKDRSEMRKLTQMQLGQ